MRFGLRCRATRALVGDLYKKKVFRCIFLCSDICMGDSYTGRPPRFETIMGSKYKRVGEYKGSIAWTSTTEFLKMSDTNMTKHWSINIRHWIHNYSFSIVFQALSSPGHDSSLIIAFEPRHHPPEWFPNGTPVGMNLTVLLVETKCVLFPPPL